MLKYNGGMSQYVVQTGQTPVHTYYKSMTGFGTVSFYYSNGYMLAHIFEDGNWTTIIQS